MDINVNIKCEELVKAINRFCDELAANGRNHIPEAKKAISKKEATKVDDNKNNDTTPEPKAIPDNTKITIEEVRSMLAKLAKDKGKGIAKKLLGDFGVSKITELDESKYSEFLKAIKEA